MIQKWIIELFYAGKLKYITDAREEKSKISNSSYQFKAEEIDKHFLLRRDTSSEASKIFGIADTKEEAKGRLYDEALKIAKNIQEVYGELGSVKFVNKVKNTKNLELKFL